MSLFCSSHSVKMADGEVSSECSSHILVNSKVNSDINYSKNCKEYERQLKEALDELTSTQVTNKLLQKELLSYTTNMNTWGNDPNPSKPTRNSAINSEWTGVTDKNRKVKANKKRDINETVINEQLIKKTNRFMPLNKGSKDAIPVIVNGVPCTIPGKRVQKGKGKTENYCDW